MGIVFRQSVKTTIVIFAGAVLGAIVNFGYVYVLSKQAVGFTRIMFAQASILQFLVSLGMAGIIQTFIQRYDRERQKVLITVSAVVPLLVGALLLIPYSLFKTQIIGLYQPGDAAIASRYYYWIPVLVMLWCYMTQMEIYLVSQYKTAISSFMREVLLKLFNVALIAFMLFQEVSLTFFIICSILFYAIPTIIMVFIAKDTEPFGFSLKWSVFDKSEVRELAKFGWYHLLMGLSVFVLGQLDTIMLGTLSKSGLASVAIYAMAVFVTSVAVAPYRAMSSAAFPTLNAVYMTDDSGALQHLFRRSAINILIVAVAMTAIIGCNLHNAVVLLPKDKGFEAIIPLVLIMLVGRLVDMATGLNTELISISKFYKFNFYIAIALVALVVLFNALLIPRYDMYGAAWGTTLALVLFNLGKMFFLWLKMGIQPLSKESFLVLLAGVVAATVGYLLPHMFHFVVDVLLRTLAIVIVYTGLLIWLKPSQDLSNYLKSIKERKRLF